MLNNAFPSNIFRSDHHVYLQIKLHLQLLVFLKIARTDKKNLLLYLYRMHRNNAKEPVSKKYKELIRENRT